MSADSPTSAVPKDLKTRSLSQPVSTTNAFEFLRYTATFSLRSALERAVAEELGEVELEVPEDLDNGSQLLEQPCKRKASPSGVASDDEAWDNPSPAAVNLPVLDSSNRRPMPSESVPTPPILGPNVPSPHNGRKAYKKRQKTAQRKEKRQQRFLENKTTFSARDMSERLDSATTIPIKISVDDLPTNSSGYEAKNPDCRGDTMPDMERLLAEGYTLIKWDGQKPLILEDEDTKKIFFVGVPKPQDPSYDSACDAVAKLLVEIGANSSGELSPEEYTHARGQGFAAIRIGIGAGHGPPQPYNLRSDKHPQAAEALRRSPELERLALHQSASFKFYMPKLYNYYHSHTLPIRRRLSHLFPSWERSIFCAAACNAGTQVTTCFHRDCRDLAFGFCVVHAVGKYDSTKGGHIVLKEPKLIIQFPSGTHVLLPSATITHGNIPVLPGETRASFTQYTAGAMFRYFDNDFGTEKQLKKKSKAKYEKMQEEKARRWEMGLGLWSTVDDLLQGTATQTVPK